MMRRLRVVKASRQDRADARWFEKHGPDPANMQIVASPEKVAAMLRRHDALTRRRRRDGTFRRRGLVARVTGR